MSTRASLAMLIISISAILISTSIVLGEDFTLSDEGLMMIKEYNKHVWGKSAIVDKRDVPGAGV